MPRTKRNVVFFASRMERLVKKDPYLSFVFKDLRRRSTQVPPSELLFAMFNANVDYQVAGVKLFDCMVCKGLKGGTLSVVF